MVLKVIVPIVVIMDKILSSSTVSGAVSVPMTNPSFKVGKSIKSDR